MTGLILQFTAGLLFGASSAFLVSINSNYSFGNSAALHQNLIEICLSVNSVPKENDLSSELVCENGATFDYREYLNNR
jgi:hypothetical protein